MAASSSGNVLLSSSSSSSSSPPSTSDLTAVLADCLPISGFSLSALWSRHKPYPAAAAAAGGNPRTRMPITLLNLKKKRLSPFSERNIRGRTEEASTISAANGQDDRRQAMRFSTSNGDDANGKLVPADDDKALLNSEAKVLTLPTILTLGRVAAIPVLLCVFYSNEWWATAAVACIFVLAAITDWLDGFLARKMGSNSTFGAFLDPVADKLMVATTLVLLSTKPLHVSWAVSLPWLIPLPSTAIIGREITMSAVREWAASQGGDLQAAVAVNKLGKWKTASQMVALAVLLATRNASESGMACQLVTVGVGLLYISAGLALWSLVVYMKGIWGALIK